MTSETATKAKGTKVRIEELGHKPFGFQVQEYKGRMYLVGREMYQNEEGELVFGRNGINIVLSDAPEFIRNLIETLCEATGQDIANVMNMVGL